jgi:putative hydrolase
MENTINQQVAKKLREAADVLEQQQANPYRVAAYRRAADTVLSLEINLEEIIEDNGLQGLEELPFIGEGIARAIYEMVTTGHWAQLQRLRGALEPTRLFQIVPGIGPELAERIHDTLSVDSLEELEIAAHTGRLEKVVGIGSRRAAAIRAAVAEILKHQLRGQKSRPREEPPVDLLLEVDETYSRSAEGDLLPTIAPKRFNPEGKAWLPVFQTDRDSWHLTALYSNTARAHQLGRTRDWVVLYFYDGDHREGQRTVVTETKGYLKGKRVVRGREAECREYYRLDQA